MDLEPEQKQNDDAEGQTQHLKIRGHPILTEGSTEVVLDGRDEDVTGVENRTGFLQDGQQDSQR